MIILLLLLLIPDDYTPLPPPPRDDPKIAAGWSPRLDSAARPYPSLRYVCLQVVELLLFFVEMKTFCVNHFFLKAPSIIGEMISHSNFVASP